MSLLVYAIAGVVILVGGYTFLVGLRMCNGAGKSRSWPSTTGVVRDVRVRRCIGCRGQPAFQPVVTYRFSVDGRAYDGTRLSLNGSAGSKWYARRVIAKYPVGTSVTVYYPPDSPSDAVLRPGIDGTLLGIPCLGVFFIAAGTYVIWAYSIGLFHK